MKFSGFELRNFRSIGNTPIAITELSKCNIIVGQNNSGKSTVIHAIKKISDWVYGNHSVLNTLDFHLRASSTPFIFKLIFQPEAHLADDNYYLERGFSTIWFEFTWENDSNRITVTDSTFAQITDFHLANDMLYHLSKTQWNRVQNKESIRQEFINRGISQFSSFRDFVPRVELIPEFRKIQKGEKYLYDGANLVDLLGNYQSPEIGNDQDREKFLKIQEFTRSLLNLPQANLEVSRQNSELIIRDNELRLPLRSFGTGAHELIILVTATLLLENTLCCIEEPEIHMHPRLQREFIDFLLQETSNTYILSTHSPTLINLVNLEKSIQVIHLRRVNGISRGITLKNGMELVSAIQDLGLTASDLLQSNSIIWVEGPSDRNFIIRWIELLAPDLHEGSDFIFVFYSQLVRLNLDDQKISGDLINAFAINRNLIFVADSDKKSSRSIITAYKKELARKAEEGGGLSWITDGKEIENYIPSSIINKFFLFVRQIELQVSIAHFNDFSNALDQKAKEVKVKAINYANCKKDYSKIIANLFTRSDITEDLLERMDALISNLRKWKS